MMWPASTKPIQSLNKNHTNLQIMKIVENLLFNRVYGKPQFVENIVDAQNAGKSKDYYHISTVSTENTVRVNNKEIMIYNTEKSPNGRMLIRVRARRA